MNGAECPGCGGITCICKEVEEDKARGRAIELALDESARSLYQVLCKPRGLRQRLLKWLFPELRDIADKLRKFYWNQ